MMFNNVLPTFVKQNYPTFQAFIAAYYEFIEQNSGQLSATSLDAIGQSFISRFSADLDYIAGLSKGLSKQDFIDNAQKLFSVKGTPAAYDLLFKLMYSDDSTTVEYPSNEIFKTSASTWAVQKFVYVNVGFFLVKYIKKNGVLLIQGVDYTVDNGFVTFTNAPTLNDSLTWSGGYSYQYQGIIAYVTDQLFMVGDGVTTFAPLTYDVGNIPYDMIGSQITFTKGIQNYVCLVGAVIKIAPTIFQVYIEDVLNDIPAGSTFQIGAIYGQTFDTINDFTSYSSGTGFKAGQTLKTSSVNSVGNTVIYINNVDSNGAVTGFTHIDSQYGKYIPTSLSFNSDTSTSPLVLIPSIKSNSSYRGSWVDNVGFLSDSSFLQDGYYYQQFSYVVKSQQLLSAFYGIAKQYIHPAGAQLFATTIARASYSIKTSLQIVLAALTLNFTDTINFEDSLAMYVEKSLQDSFTTIDTVSSLVGKVFSSINQIFNVTNSIVVLDNGYYRSILNNIPVINLVTNPNFSGSSTAFPTVYTPGTVKVFVDGLILQQIVDYDDSSGGNVVLTNTYPVNTDFIVVNGNTIITHGTFSASSNNIVVSGGYTSGNILVYINGILLQQTADYDDTSGTNIVLTNTYPIGTDFVVDTGTTIAQGTFSASSTTIPVSYNSGNVLVYINGLLLRCLVDYDDSSGTNIVLRNTYPAGTNFSIVVGKIFSQGSTNIATNVLTLPNAYNVVGDNNSTVNSYTISTIQSSILSIVANVTGNAGDTIVLTVPLNLPSTIQTYTASYIASTNPTLVCSLKFTINGVTSANTISSFSTAYTRFAASLTPSSSISSSSLTFEITLDKNYTNAPLTIIFGNPQVQSGTIPTYFVNNTASFPAMYSVNGSTIVLSNPVPAFQILLIGMSGTNAVTNETFDSYSAVNYSNLDSSLMTTIGTSDGTQTVYNIPSPDSMGTMNKIAIAKNPYTSEDYFLTYYDGLSQYVSSAIITTE